MCFGSGDAEARIVSCALVLGMLKLDCVLCFGSGDVEARIVSCALVLDVLSLVLFII